MKNHCYFAISRYPYWFVVDYGTSVEQYMVLTDDELADYLKHGTQTGE